MDVLWHKDSSWVSSKQLKKTKLIINDLLAIHKRCFTQVITQGLGIEQWFDQDNLHDCKHFEMISQIFIFK